MSDFITVDLIQHSVTISDRGAYQVSKTGDRRDAFWIPKSQVTGHEILARLVAGDLVRFEIPAWLAREHGLQPTRAAGLDDLFSTEERSGQ